MPLKTPTTVHALLRVLPGLAILLVLTQRMLPPPPPTPPTPPTPPRP